MGGIARGGRSISAAAVATASPPRIIALAVRWYLRFCLSYAGVAELLAERGVAADPSTVYDRVCQFAPPYEDAARPFRRSVGGT